MSDFEARPPAAPEEEDDEEESEAVVCHNRSGGFSIESIIRSGKTSSAEGGELTIVRVPPRTGTPSPLSEAECFLETRELWNRFFDLGTEMIITKTGRRMFPTVRCSFAGLSPEMMYHVVLDVVPSDDKRYRYAYHRSSWLVAGKADPPPPHRFYVHPDGPFTAGQLNRRHVVSFEKVKLTNNELDKTGQMVLNSMHKFQPRIRLVSLLERTEAADPEVVRSLLGEESPRRTRTFVYPETAFMAVTAYQNQLITKLKIDSNPFAKGFRDSSRLAEFERENLECFLDRPLQLHLRQQRHHHHQSEAQHPPQRRVIEVREEEEEEEEPKKNSKDEGEKREDVGSQLQLYAQHYLSCQKKLQEQLQLQQLHPIVYALQALKSRQLKEQQRKEDCEQQQEQEQQVPQATSLWGQWVSLQLMAAQAHLRRAQQQQQQLGDQHQESKDAVRFSPYELPNKTWKK